MPSGLPPGVPSHCGTFTTNFCFTPVPLYKVDLPVSLSDTHQGLPPLAAMPHGLTRSGSVGCVPTFEMSDTRLVIWKVWAVAGRFSSVMATKNSTAFETGRALGRLLSRDIGIGIPPPFSDRCAGKRTTATTAHPIRKQIRFDSRDSCTQQVRGA